MEFALVGPLFVLLLVGLVVYGGWFWLAQGVQHCAAEGARAALGGLDSAERVQLARDAATRAASGSSAIPPADIGVTVSDDGHTLQVVVTYESAGHPMMALAGLVPSPPSRIRRASAVRVGGY